MIFENQSFHHTDHLSGSSVETGAKGAVLQLTDYHPYGTTRYEKSTTTYNHDYKFTGKELDESGLYYYGARYYNPGIGRFMSEDPSSRDVPEKFLSDPQALNFYAYARNNPLKYIDPNGQWSIAAADKFFQQQMQVVMNVGDFLTFGQFSQAVNGAIGAGQKMNQDGVNVSTVTNAVKEVATGSIMLGGTALLEGLTIGEGIMGVSAVLDAKAVEKQSQEFSQTQGGLNLFKSGKSGKATTSVSSGWKEGDRMLNIPDQGSPKANWELNFGMLREEIRNGNPIFDSYRYQDGERITTGGFLKAERYILENMGWSYDSATGAYNPPSIK